MNRSVKAKPKSLVSKTYVANQKSMAGIVRAAMSNKCSCCGVTSGHLQSLVTKMLQTLVKLSHTVRYRKAC